MATFDSVPLGQDSWVALAEETTWGTEVNGNGAGRALWLDADGDDMDQATNRVETEQVGLLGFAKEYSSLGTQNAQGSLQFEFPAQGMEWFLKHGFGQDTVAAGGGGTTAHTFVIRNIVDPARQAGGTVQGLTCWVNRGLRAANSGGAVFGYRGSQVSALEFSLTKDQNLKAKVELACKDVVITRNPLFSPAFPSGVDLTFFNYTQGAFQIDFGGGYVTGDIEEFRCRIDRKLELDHFMSAPGGTSFASGATYTPWRSRKRPLPNGKLTAEMSFVADFDRDDWINALNNSTNVRIQMSFLGLLSRSLTFDTEIGHVPGYVIVHKPQITNEGRIRARTTVRLYRNYNESNGELRVILSNGQTGI